MRGSIETLTVLFTDLVGSTGQRVRLGEGAADALRRRHDQVTSAVIRRHRGTIVKHTGDGVMATFAGASDAIAAAVGIQQAIDGDNRSRRHAENAAELLSVRIGVSAGDVAVEDGDCFGLPVIEAQRLEAAAAPGQVLVSALVGALARGRNQMALRAVGPLELKGLEGPLDTLEVVWSPADPPSGDQSLPTALVDRSGVPFAGRVDELNTALRVWQEAASGETRTLLVAGEPGIGKTRLLGELATRTIADGLVLVGRCDEHVRVPYQPFVEALTAYVQLPGVAETLDDSAGELTRIVPVISARRPDLVPRLTAAPDAERLALFDAVRTLVAGATTERPLLLVVDDAHWADAESLLLLRHIVATQPVSRLLVAVTYRDTDVTSSHPVAAVLADLRRRSDVTRVHLGGLDERDVTAIVSGGRPSDPTITQLGAAVHEDTGGNPFFVGEVVRHLRSTGELSPVDEALTPGAPKVAVLPEGIRDVVGRRLALLPEASQRVLREAAVVGTRFDIDVVAAMTGSTHDELLDAFEPALAAHVIVENGVGRYQFAHALVRSTLYTELSTTRRARLHERVAVAIEELDDADPTAVAAVADLAHHWSQAAGAHARSKAIAFARRAAEMAYKRSAPDEAARWYRHAREILDGEDPQLDARLLYEQGLAESMASAPEWQQTLLTAARAADELGDVALMADALIIDGRFTLTTSESDPVAPEKIPLLEQAWSRLEDDPALRTRVAAALAKELTVAGETARAIDMMANVRSYADSLDDPVEQARYGALTVAVWDAIDETREEVEHWWRLFTEVLPIVKERGDLELAGMASNILFYVGLTLGEPNRHEVLQMLEQLKAAYPHPNFLDHLVRLRSLIALIDGDLPAAEAWSRDAHAQWVAHGRDRDARVYTEGTIVQLRRERAGLATLADAMPRQPMFEGSLQTPSAVGGVYAAALADAGRVDDLQRLVDERAANDFADLPRDASRPVARCFWAEAVAAARHRRGCRALYDHIAPLHDTHETTGGWYLGATSRYLALLASALDQRDQAEEWFARAAGAHARLQTATWLARTHVEWSEHRLHSGDVPGAHELAAVALEVIGDRDLRHSRSRAERILRA